MKRFLKSPRFGWKLIASIAIITIICTYVDTQYGQFYGFITCLLLASSLGIAWAVIETINYKNV